MVQTVSIPCPSPTFTEAVTIIDAEDAEAVAGIKWTASRSGVPMTPYVMARIKGQRVRLHRLILGVTDPKVIVDHINGDTLDNRRCNLRTCSQADNSRNTRGTQGRDLPKGVKLLPSGNYWARIMVNRREISLGSYRTKSEAAQAYNQAAFQHFGDFARPSEVQP